ncbi:MAG: hypothetical protein OEY20_16525 [Gemmatimonadota bacterium]|nr:hypothetical protein [Gemmatimonadota bacterium]
MAQHFDYYDDWKTATLECTNCGWKGTWEEGEVEYYDGLMDCSCANCGGMLAIVAYPTIAESEANWSRLTPLQQLEVEVRKQFIERWEAAHLESPDQLPDLEGPDLALVWDFVEEKPDSLTVLKHGETEIWREPALYEGFRRFAEIVSILKQKYGSRLADVVPTPASEYYLYGDKIAAPHYVEEILKSLHEGRGLTPPPCSSA